MNHSALRGIHKASAQGQGSNNSRKHIARRGQGLLGKASQRAVLGFRWQTLPSEDSRKAPSRHQELPCMGRYRAALGVLIAQTSLSSELTFKLYAPWLSCTLSTSSLNNSVRTEVNMQKTRKMEMIVWKQWPWFYSKAIEWTSVQDKGRRWMLLSFTLKDTPICNFSTFISPFLLLSYWQISLPPESFWN